MTGSRCLVLLEGVIGQAWLVNAGDVKHLPGVG